ncbi:UDP-3-O-[3-hydroxymyristoyl] N-acetylglucosamine deacetylase [hydrothermal vent metagenome]|uniref:UDP-3-O-acyl-N-acetylglucosamine deacetylase n=1 Tax=hydrothermal vent metagenome TaxID=652676 RepID=A0A3B0RIC8_9ZZZZ
MYGAAYLLSLRFILSNERAFGLPEKLPAMNVYQHTLAAPILCTGTGLHTGTWVRMVLHPLSAGSGIRFVRSDISDRDNSIALGITQVVDSRRGTKIANTAGVQINTVEHLLSALAAYGVDNVQIDVDGPEIPAMDGSATVFADLLGRVGLVRQAAPRKYIKVLQELNIKDGVSHACFTPHDRFEIDAGIEYDNPVIGEQTCKFDVNPAAFAGQIARARTFALRAEVDSLQASGKAAGGSLDNCLVVGEKSVENKGGLRFDDEFARHKALDALGDLCLAAAPLLCRYRVRRAGHWINHLAVKQLLADPTKWTITTLMPTTEAASFHAAQ